MTSFAEEMSARLPDGMRLPDPLVALFVWIEAQGFLHASERVPGDHFGTLQALEEPYRGAVVLFRVETQAQARDYAQAWFGRPEFAARLVPFAKTSGDGGYAALWLDEAGHQHIVHLGSEGEALCVLGKDAVDFLRLLAIGYNELCVGLTGPDEAPRDAPEFGTLVANPPFQDWVRTTFDVEIPATAGEIVGRPPDSFASAGGDAFWTWARAQQVG